VSRAAGGLKKNGIPSNSGGVGGHRYNGRILAKHIARTHFGVELHRPAVKPDDLVPLLLHELDHGPEMWHQRSYHCRVVSVSADDGIRDEGIWPLANFVDSGGPDAIAATIEANVDGQSYPAFYVRKDNKISEQLLEPSQSMAFDSPERRAALGEIVRAVTGTEVPA